MVCMLLVFLWLAATKGINGVKDFVFWKQAAVKQKAIDAKLSKIDEMEKAFDQTLVEYAKSKEALAAAKRETDIRTEIFNNDAKSAAQQVKEFEKAVAEKPVVTDPTGVTMEQLCLRAKTSGGSEATIRALCPAG